MPISLPVSLTSAALLLLPLSARCVPLDLLGRQDEPSSTVTETVMSTFFLTSTTTTYLTTSYLTISSSPTQSVSSTAISSSANSTDPIVAISADPSQLSAQASSPDTSQTLTPTSSFDSASTSGPSTGSVTVSGSPVLNPSSVANITMSDSNPTLTPAPSTTPSPTTSEGGFFTTPPSQDKKKNPSPTPAAPPQRQVMAYYPDWATAEFPPEKIDFQRLDWIDFAFAVPDENLNLSWDGSENAPDMLTRLVSAAHASGKHVKLSVGGWTGSKYFSTASSTPANRQKLANNILAFYKRFNLDGIDIDWEYPGQAGNDGNVVSPNDSANYLAFLRTLRATLPPGAKITAATMTVPFADPQGNPMSDVSEFAKVLDWILLMNYDTWGSSSNPGPNAPLNDACGNSTQATANALAAVKAWTSAGFPASQIVLGVPSYGYISRSNIQTLHTRRSVAPLSGSRGRRHRSLTSVNARKMLEYTELAPQLPPTVPDLPTSTSPNTSTGTGMSTSTVTSVSETQTGTPRSPAAQVENVHDMHLVDPTEVDELAADVAAEVVAASAAPGMNTLVQNEDGGTENGQVQFRDLLKQGVLAYIPEMDVAEFASRNMKAMTQTFAGKAIQNLFTGFSQFERHWDGCSNTPYLRSGPAKQVVTYDDPQSLEMKATFAKEAGLLGVNMFDVHGDTDHWDLTDAIRRGLGLS